MTFHRIAGLIFPWLAFSIVVILVQLGIIEIPGNDKMPLVFLMVLVSFLIIYSISYGICWNRATPLSNSILVSTGVGLGMTALICIKMLF